MICIRRLPFTFSMCHTSPKRKGTPLTIFPPIKGTIAEMCPSSVSCGASSWPITMKLQLHLMQLFIICVRICIVIALRCWYPFIPGLSSVALLTTLTAFSVAISTSVVTESSTTVSMPFVRINSSMRFGFARRHCSKIVDDSSESGISSSSPSGTLPRLAVASGSNDSHSFLPGAVAASVVFPQPDIPHSNRSSSLSRPSRPGC